MSTRPTYPLCCPMCGESYEHEALDCPALKNHEELLAELLRCRKLLRQLCCWLPDAPPFQPAIRARLAWPKEGR